MELKAADQSVEANLTPALQRFLGAHGAVCDVRVMEDGHAGLTFGFELRGADNTSRGYILKKAPEGVPRGGSTDVFRQAAVLRALSGAGFPAPDVPWASANDDVLGAPFVIMQRLPGRSVIVWDPSPAMIAQFDNPAAIWTEAARLMGALHAFDWRRQLSDWQEPTDLATELARWTRLLRHMQDEDMQLRAQQLAERLTETAPANGAIGLVHGDLQPGNVLYQDGKAQGLIDWDLAGIGPIGMDVGWLLMIADAQGWADDWRPHGAPSRDVLLDAYRDAGGVAPSHVDWFQAFSNFRMAAITGLNLKLHRDGRRRDPIWERFASSLPAMLGRALTLLQRLEENAA